MRIRKQIALFISFIALMKITLTAQAASTPVTEHFVTDDGKAVLYIAGIEDSATECKFQIGNNECEILEASSIKEAGGSIHTIILWDNSVSVMGRNDAMVRSLLNDIISNRGENEIFTLATLSTDVDFQVSDTNNYVELKNIIEKTTMEDKDAFVVENLYNIVYAINQIKDYDFYRVIVISDGDDSTQQGASISELLAALKETPYPIYTISTGGSSVDVTKNLFSISRATNTCYFSLTGDGATSVDDILNTLRADTDIARIVVDIPSEIQDGSIRNSQLTINGQTYECELKMPFGIKTDSDVQDAEDTNISVETKKKSFPIMPVVVCILGTGVVVACIFMILDKRKKKQKRLEQEQKDKFDELYGKDESEEYTMLTGESETVFMEEAESNDGNRTVFMAGNVATIVLTNVSNASENYSAELIGTVSVGRGVRNTITITGNKAVSERHCEFFKVDGELYVRDVGSSNGTKIRDEKITTPVMISDGEVLTIGFSDYKIGIQE